MVNFELLDKGKLVKLIETKNQTELTLNVGRLLYIELYTLISRKDMLDGNEIYSDKGKIVHLTNGKVELKISHIEYIRLLNRIKRRVTFIRENEELSTEELSYENFVSNHFSKGFCNIIITNIGTVMYLTPKLLEELMREVTNSIQEIMNTKGYVIMNKDEIRYPENYKLTELQDKTIREIKMRGTLQ